MPLESLSDHNTRRLGVYAHPYFGVKPFPNGIACPNCGNELYDSNPAFMLTSYPPQYRVHCEHCHYSGYRVA
jgi:hypothetical protein